MNSHYEAVLADLEQRREEIDVAIRAIKKLMARSS